MKTKNFVMIWLTICIVPVIIYFVVVGLNINKANKVWEQTYGSCEATWIAYNPESYDDTFIIYDVSDGPYKGVYKVDGTKLCNLYGLYRNRAFTNVKVIKNDEDRKYSFTSEGLYVETPIDICDEEIKAMFCLTLMEYGK